MRLAEPEPVSIGKGYPTVHQLFSEQAARTPERLAVASLSEQLTYADLERYSNQLARHLISVGVRPGASVGVAFERSVRLPVALLGILKAGAAYVALDPSYPPDRLAFMCHDAAISVAITAGIGFRHRLGTGMVTVDLLGDNSSIGASSFESLPAVSDGESLAYVTYTSGSTGRPKGVAIPHRGVVRLVRGADYVEIGADDVFLHFAPLAFDASTFEIWGPLLNGARLAVPEPGPLSMAELGRSLQRLGVTTLWLTAPLFRLMVETELESLGGLRALLAGGDVVSPAHARRFLEAFPACRLINGYGPTENTTFSCCYRIPSADSVRGTIPIGRAIAKSTAYVLDSDLHPVGAGESGELYVGGDGVALGYLNLPELTAERFLRDPFSVDAAARLYRTGDLARLRPDGIIEFLGRRDHQVKVRGFRVELGEIESALEAHSGVLAAAVVVAQSEVGNELLFAFVVPTPGDRLEERELRKHLTRDLPRYMLPQHIEIVDALPAHASGKLDRVALARRAVAPKLDVRPEPSAAPFFAGAGATASIQSRIAEVWRAVLGAGADPAPDDNFFDAGGDSLSLLILQRRLQQVLAIKLSVTDLFAHTTIRKQASFIENLLV